MNFQFYIVIIIFSGLIYKNPVTAQPFLSLDPNSRPGSAQSNLNIEGSQVFSTFKFSTKISNGDKAFTENQAYSRTSGNAFSLVYERINSNGIFELIGIGMRKAGSELVYKNIDYIWKLQYAELKAGLGYQINRWRIKPYIAAVPYYSYLLDAKQSVGLRNYDLKASKTIRNYDLGLFMALGFRAAISRQISVYSEYNYILGLKNLETTVDQYLYNRGFSIKLGLSLNITSSVKSAEKMPKDLFGLHAESSEPAFISEIPTVKIPPPIDPGKETAVSINTEVSSPITNLPEESPVIENKPESVGKDLESVNNNTQESLANTVAPNKQMLVKENRSESLDEVEESVKKAPSNDFKNSKPITKVSAEKVSKGNNSNVLPKNKLEKAPITRNRMPSKIVFKIQIGSVSRPLTMNHPLLKNLTGKIEKEIGKDGMIRYYSGIFESYDEARSFLTTIKSNGGNEGAFVVAFKNGKQITVYEAKKLVEEDY